MVVISVIDLFATKEDIAKLETKIAESAAQLTMRMFYFWVGQVAAIAGPLAYFFKSAGHWVLRRVGI